MRAALMVFIKEFFENLRDRRTVLVALVVGPLFGPALFAAMLQFSIDRGGRDLDEPLSVAVINAEAAPQLMAWLADRDVSATPFIGDADAAKAAVRERRAALVLEIPADIGRHLQSGAPAVLPLYNDASNNDSQRQVRRLRALVGAWAQGIAVQRLALRGVDPVVLAPVTLQDVDVSTPASRAVTIIGMLSFFLILAMMTGGMYLAIDTTVGERERGTLEPLLTTATSRESLLLGKLMATCSYMLLSLVLTTVSFFVVFGFVDLEQLGMSANLDRLTALRVIGVTAPLVPVAGALLTLVASFARSIREAQAWLSVTQLVPTLPLVFATMTNVVPSLKWMWVPSLSQHFLITRLLRAEPVESQELVLSVSASLALGVALTLVATRLYRRERLVT